MKEKMLKKDYLTTNEIAPFLGVKPSTLIRGLCVNGSYLGIRPRKLPNGRLLWPKTGLDRILYGEEEV